MSERMSDSRIFEVLTASPVRLSSSPARSYRSWSDEEKTRIVGERRWLPVRMYRRSPSQMGSIRRNCSRGVARRRAPGWLRHRLECRTSRSSLRALMRCGATW